MVKVGLFLLGHVLQWSAAEHLGSQLGRAPTLCKAQGAIGGVCFPGAQGVWQEAEVRLMCLKGTSNQLQKDVLPHQWCTDTGLTISFVYCYSFYKAVRQGSFVLLGERLFLTSVQFEPSLPDVGTAHFPLSNKFTNHLVG